MDSPVISANALTAASHQRMTDARRPADTAASPTSPAIPLIEPIVQEQRAKQYCPLIEPMVQEQRAKQYCLQGCVCLCVLFVMLLAIWGIDTAWLPPPIPPPVEATLVLANGQGTFVRNGADMPSELVVPTGTELTLNLTSQDYIYALRQEQLLLNVMVITDRAEAVAFQLNSPGTYQLEFSPMCGRPWQHAAPPVIVVTP